MIASSAGPMGQPSPLTCIPPPPDRTTPILAHTPDSPGTLAGADRDPCPLLWFRVKHDDLIGAENHGRTPVLGVGLATVQALEQGFGGHAVVGPPADATSGQLPRPTLLPVNGLGWARIASSAPRRVRAARSGRSPSLTGACINSRHGAPSFGASRLGRLDVRHALPCPRSSRALPAGARSRFNRPQDSIQFNISNIHAAPP